MNNSSTSNDNTENQGATNDFSSSGPAKKRKTIVNEMSSSSIELEILQFANEKLKQYVKKLEAERLQYTDGRSEEKIMELEDTLRKQQAHILELNAKIDDDVNGCNDVKILKLEDTVKKLQELNISNEQKHKAEMEEYTAKIKTYEDEKKQSNVKIKELNDEIATMKIIKTEIKDTVENERENAFTENEKFKAEIKELESKLTASEFKNKEMEKIYGETIAANQQLEQKLMESTMNQSMSASQIIDGPSQSFSQTTNAADESQLPGSIALGSNRFVISIEYKGKNYVHIREYYRQKDGTLLPSRKGISFTNVQLKTFIEKIPEIKEKFA